MILNASPIACAPVAHAVAGVRVELRVVDGHLRRGDGVVDEGVGLLDLLLFDPLPGLEAADLAGDLAGEGAGVELADAIDAGPSVEEAAPGRLVADPQRRDHADPADHNTAFIHARSVRTAGKRSPRRAAGTDPAAVPFRFYEALARLSM